jgi:Ser-tRNA(Ala) deacylase AlaX
MLNLTPKVGIERYIVLSNELYHHAVDTNACDHNLVWTYIISTKRKYHYRNHSNGWILKHVNNNVLASTLQFHMFHDIHPLVFNLLEAT